MWMKSRWSVDDDDGGMKNELFSLDSLSLTPAMELSLCLSRAQNKFFTVI